MVTDRNRRTPLGNCALIPANTEVVRGWKPGIGDDSERLDTLASGGRSKRSIMIVAVVRATGYRTMFRRSSGSLLGVSASKPKRGRLSVSKGTREARLSRVVAQLGRSTDRSKHLPMRQSSGGVPVVVRDVNDVHMAKGCRMICVRTTEVFFNLEVFK